tara:strand:+ start:498 stop:785 length:288 start_codon:yes stop_codon:yes gene_type:complete
MSEDYEQLFNRAEELEHEVQIQCEENERLRKEVERLDSAYKNHRTQFKLLMKAGNYMCVFIEERIEDDFFFDEALDAANHVIDKWHDAKNEFSKK